MRISTPTAIVLLGAIVVLAATAIGLVALGASGETIAMVLASVGGAAAAVLAYMRSLRAPQQTPPTIPPRPLPVRSDRSDMEPDDGLEDRDA